MRRIVSFIGWAIIIGIIYTPVVYLSGSDVGFIKPDKDTIPTQIIRVNGLGDWGTSDRPEKLEMTDKDGNTILTWLDRDWLDESNITSG